MRRASVASARAATPPPTRPCSTPGCTCTARARSKRDFRSLWIVRINAAARTVGTSYSKLIGKLGKAGVALNRKMLSEIAISDPAAFQAIAAA
jgi:ribosomal protein L20